jgi:hypothetical protein
MKSATTKQLIPNGTTKLVATVLKTFNRTASPKKPNRTANMQSPTPPIQLPNAMFLPLSLVISSFDHLLVATI